MKNTLAQLATALILCVLAVLLFNPTHLFMPSMMVVALIATTLAAFGLFASFIVNEREGDEREVIHRMHAGRVAFLTGSAVLTFGIVVEAWSHSVDPWLVLALLLMVIAKLVSRIYLDRSL